MTRPLAGWVRPAWNPNWLLGLLLVAGTILAYQPVWHAGFIWDDDRHVTQNRMLFEADGLKQIWFSPDSPQYYPLVFTSFRLERGFFAVFGGTGGIASRAAPEAHPEAQATLRLPRGYREGSGAGLEE
jgi:hypothetical protein